MRICRISSYLTVLAFSVFNSRLPAWFPILNGSALPRLQRLKEKGKERVSLKSSALRGFDVVFPSERHSCEREIYIYNARFWEEETKALKTEETRPSHLINKCYLSIPRKELENRTAPTSKFCSVTHFNPSQEILQICVYVQKYLSIQPSSICPSTHMYTHNYIPHTGVL